MNDVFNMGWYENATKRRSPHCDNRPDDNDISAIVIHCISLPCGCYGESYVDDLFMGCINCEAMPEFSDLEGLKVSSHFFVSRHGELIQYVPVTKRAWHAGESVFEGREKVNDFSIGIELEGTDTDIFTDAQYSSLHKLVLSLMENWPINIECIVGHSDIAPGRKTDPGTGFDWQGFRQHLIAGS